MDKDSLLQDEPRDVAKTVKSELFENVYYHLSLSFEYKVYTTSCWDVR